MTSDPAIPMTLLFALLVAALVGVSLATGSRPRSAREWTWVWGVFVFLAWVLVGFGWLRSA
jgi:hypothetical protein